MSSTYNGNGDIFSSSLTLVTDGDPSRASLFRVPSERLLDNDMHLRALVDEAALRQSTSLRATDAAFTSVLAQVQATCLRAEENFPGPMIAIKVGQAKAVYNQDKTEDYPGGAIPNLTSITGVAVNEAGRIVVTGGTSPYCAYRVPGGTWTAGGSQIGDTPTRLIYSPAYAGFLASRSTSTSVYRSTDATSWASAASNLAGAVFDLAAVGAGGGAGRIVALGSAATPTFSMSSDNGATFTAQANTVPFAAQADSAGSLEGCPVVTRLGLNEFVYHAARYDSGALIRVARSADGESWEAGASFAAPTGMAFTGFPALHICKSTGLMALVTPAQITDDAHDVTLVYVSRNYFGWVGEAVHDFVGTSAYAVANGRVLLSPDATLLVSDGISHRAYAP